MLIQNSKRILLQQTIFKDVIRINVMWQSQFLMKWNKNKCVYSKREEKNKKEREIESMHVSNDRTHKQQTHFISTNQFRTFHASIAICLSINLIWKWNTRLNWIAHNNNTQNCKFVQSAKMTTRSFQTESKTQKRITNITIQTIHTFYPNNILFSN